MFMVISSVTAHDLHARYVSWGVDEYELFGLTKGELKKSFKNTVFFNEDFTNGRLCREGDYGPQFILTFENGHVSSVQRMFIDGGGCHIMGPILESKKEALQFSIEGLSSNPDGCDAADRRRLLSAQALLKNLESPAESTTHK